MKHRFMTQDTCLIIFNVWLAALILSSSVIQIVFTAVMVVMWHIILIMAAKRDRKEQERVCCDY